MTYKEVTYFSGIEKQDKVKQIISERANVVKHALARDYGKTGLVNYFSLGDEVKYSDAIDNLRKDVLAYCGEKAGVSEFLTDEDFVNALDNPTFISVYNAIEAGVIRQVFTNLESKAIDVIANVDTVGLGNSKTYNLSSKGLPVAQRNSYLSNVAFLNGATSQPLTIVPRVYSLGVSIDLLRILKGDQDWARETSKVIMGMLYAQYRLVVATLFSTSLLSGTPFALASWDTDTHIKVIEILRTINNSQVVGYGTISALRKASIGSIEIAASVFGGLNTQDTFIKDGFVSHVNGIDYVLLDNAYDFSAPLEATVNGVLGQFLVPSDKILLLCPAQDKPVKLVRENYVRVRLVEPQDNSILTRSYAYFMSFETGIATMSQFAIQTV